MPRFIIERELPGVGALSPEQLRELARRNCAVLRELGPEIRWIESWVTADRIYCVFLAPDESLIREHAARSGVPSTRVARIRACVTPSGTESTA